MSNLDDFFAKKDKKKKKGKFNKANTDILAKTLEENDRKEAEMEEKSQGVLATSEAAKAAVVTAQNREHEGDEEGGQGQQGKPQVKRKRG